MPNMPYPVTAENLEDLRTQVNELFRQLFEDFIGGAELGDVFTASNDVFTLTLATNGGLEKVANELKVKEASEGWAVTNKTVDRTLDCNSGDVNVNGDVLGTLIDDLITQGYLKA